jgi:PAS domain S-box-containing protein
MFIQSLDPIVLEQILNAANGGIAISDAQQPDNPLVYVNSGFERMTGYLASEIEGRNCRFLQGAETDAATVQKLRQSIEKKQTVSVDIVNYKKSGEKFWNHLSMAPLLERSGSVRYFIGVQYDITPLQEKKIALEKQTLCLEEAHIKREKAIAGLTNHLRDAIAACDSISTLMLLNKNLTQDKMNSYTQQINHTIRQTTNILDKILLDLRQE